MKDTRAATSYTEYVSIDIVSAQIDQSPLRPSLTTSLRRLEEHIDSLCYLHTGSQGYMFTTQPQPDCSGHCMLGRQKNK